MKYAVSFLLGMMFIIILDIAWASQAYAACGPISCDEEGYDAIGYGHENIGRGHDTPSEPYGNRNRGTYMPDDTSYPTTGSPSGAYYNNRGNEVYRPTQPSLQPAPKAGYKWNRYPSLESK